MSDLIYPISLRRIDSFILDAKKDDLIFCKNTEYYGIYNNGILMGFGGILKYRKKVIFKSIYVIPKYRRQGIFKNLLTFLIKTALNNGINIGEANCTQMSINELKNRGFIEVKKYNNGVIKVKNENLQQTKRI